ncbi:hypothetical protein N798_16030 [Knoellia flava TL1]|uniref:DUF4870 domain-containing protein n=2 Tax=Knoellia flava TaxID=913969 RepID=A0A8H9KRF7_9MICO|nr:DUF4870 domain-containing protein [Knoellia flava]KGN29122.1 hypothetical protein N798_16030 [Knoellia flava TL1]GGB69440.1 hypothetical protein GCM10011314_05910 [Knoellia flava]
MSTTPDPEFHGQHRPDPTADPSTEPAAPQAQAPQAVPQAQVPQGQVPPPPAPQGSVPPPPPSQGYSQPPPQPAYPQGGYPQGGYPQTRATHPGQATAYGQQVLDPAQQRQWGMFAHLVPLVAMVLSAGLLGFVGSLVIYVLYKDRGDFVRQHAANSLNIQILTGIVLLVSLPLMLVLVGFLTYFAALAVAFVLHIIGALRANEGQLWTPPMTPSFVK